MKLSIPNKWKAIFRQFLCVLVGWRDREICRWEVLTDFQWKSVRNDFNKKNILRSLPRYQCNLEEQDQNRSSEVYLKP